MTLEQEAAAAMSRNEVTKVICASKHEVLGKIKRGEADALSVTQTGVVLENGELLSHHAVVFHDRKLGERVRQAMMRGFGLGA